MKDTESVGRAGLLSSEDGRDEWRSPSPSTRAQMQARLSNFYAGDAAESSDRADASEDQHHLEADTVHKDVQDQDGEGYHFRLFATAQTKPPSEPPHKTTAKLKTVIHKDTDAINASAGAVRVRIDSPSPADSRLSPGLVKPRPPRDYLSGPITLELMEEFRCSAVSGETIRLLASQSWPGCALPWRVQRMACLSETAASSGRTIRIEGENNATEGSKPRKRPSKKRRVLLRRRAQNVHEAKLMRHNLEAEKQAEAEERRKRKNREKNVRRRTKEKAKKMEQRASEPEKQALDTWEQPLQQTEGAEDKLHKGL